jgi:thiol-disulfide isomerase/thioredoxin
MRFSSITVLLVVVLSLNRTWVQQALSQDLPALPVRVEWHNGDVLLGEFAALDETRIRIRSRLFLEPIDLELASLRTVQMGGGRWEGETQADKKLILNDGTTLRGKVESDDPQSSSLSFRDEVVGLLRVERTKVSSLESLDSTVYEWNGDLKAWSSLETDQLAGWRVNEKGHLQSSQSDTTAFLGMAVSNSFATTMTLSSVSMPNFEIAFGPDSEKSLRLATVRNRLIVGTSEDFDVICELPDGKWTMNCRIEWDAEKKELRFSDSDNHRVAIKNQAAESMEGVYIRNRGDSLTIEELKLYSNVEGGKSGTTPEATMPKRLSTNQLVARFRNGLILVGQPIRFEDGILSWKGDDLGLVKVSVQELVRIEMPDSSKKAKDEHRLELGQNLVSGRLQFRTTERPLGWQCVGQRQAVPLNPELATLVRINQTKSINLNKFEDLGYSKSGDIIPVHLSRMTESSAEVTTPFSATRSVSSNSLRAIEFRRQGKPLEHVFTNESREQLLGFPRGTDASLFRNALIGGNGDLLRGGIVSINDTSVEMEVRLEPCLIARESVAALIFLDEPADIKKRDEAKPEQPNVAKPSSPVVRIGFRSDFFVEATLLKADETQIVCQSDWLGELTIPTSMISSVQLGAQSEKPSSYAAWNTRTLSSPAWVESDDTQGESELIGTSVDDFRLASLNGDAFQLRDHAGQVIVLDFWATWCGPCVKLLPEYLEVLKEYSETEVVFRGVNATETPDVVRDFLERKSIVGFETLFDYDGQLSQSMKVTGIPHTVVIGPDGKIKHVHRGYTKNAAKQLKGAIDSALDRNKGPN